MPLAYSGPHGEYPVYRCRIARREYNRPGCQEVRALALDAEIERRLFAALEPDKLALALATLEQFEQENATRQRQWQLRLEHVRYEAERAARQYHAVEPEHRLVARTLEREWEDRLRALEDLEQVHRDWEVRQAVTLTEADRQAIRALAGDFPKVWYAPTTTPADRKHLLRLVIQSVIVDAKANPDQVRYRIVWQTGATEEHGVHRYPHREEPESRLRDLNAQGKTDDDIVAVLDAEGFQTARGHRFTGHMVWLLRQQWQVPVIGVNSNAPHPLRWQDGTYSAEGLAQTVGVAVGTIYRWLREGQATGHQSARGMPWKIPGPPEDIERLKRRVQQAHRTSRFHKEAL